jgi:hypothetical protein
MPLPIEQFIKRLASLSDASLLCEILGIEPEDIIDRFHDLIEDNLSELRSIFDVDMDFEPFDLDIMSEEDYTDGPE